MIDRVERAAKEIPVGPRVVPHEDPKSGFVKTQDFRIEVVDRQLRGRRERPPVGRELKEAADAVARPIGAAADVEGQLEYRV